MKIQYNVYTLQYNQGSSVLKMVIIYLKSSKLERNAETVTLRIFRSLNLNKKRSTLRPNKVLPHGITLDKYPISNSG